LLDRRWRGPRSEPRAGSSPPDNGAGDDVAEPGEHTVHRAALVAGDPRLAPSGAQGRCTLRRPGWPSSSDSRPSCRGHRGPPPAAGAERVWSSGRDQLQGLVGVVGDADVERCGGVVGSPGLPALRLLHPPAASRGPARHAVRQPSSRGERLIRERQRKSRLPAMVSALNRSFLLAVAGTAVYMFIRGYGLLSPRLTWRAARGAANPWSRELDVTGGLGRPVLQE
jgi:hypothetical protein